MPRTIIRRFDEPALRVRLRQEVGDLLSEAFGVDDDVRSRGWTQLQPAVRFLALVDQTVVGHQALVVLREHEPSLVGLSDLAVSQSYRRRGIGRALVEAALADPLSVTADALLAGVSVPVLRQQLMTLGFQPVTPFKYFYETMTCCSWNPNWVERVSGAIPSHLRLRGDF
jgi:predicted N-acetyltransferase YhbS